MQEPALSTTGFSCPVTEGGSSWLGLEVGEARSAGMSLTHGRGRLRVPSSGSVNLCLPLLQPHLNAIPAAASVFSREKSGGSGSLMPVNEPGLWRDFISSLQRSLFPRQGGGGQNRGEQAASGVGGGPSQLPKTCACFAHPQLCLEKAQNVPVCLWVESSGFHLVIRMALLAA